MLSRAERPETQVSDKAKRRRFSAEYKQRILREAAGCNEVGAIGALLRREGLYSSHLAVWRQQAERGQAAALTPKKRGPKAKEPDTRGRELATSQREAARWRKRAERAEALVEVQKKISQLLGIALPPTEEPDS
jgi:transposase